MCGGRFVRPCDRSFSCCKRNNQRKCDRHGRQSCLGNLKKGDIIQISYIGYATQEITYTGQPSIPVTLKEDTQALQEVVVVGYGTMKKSDVTGSISTAKGDDLAERIKSFSALDNLRGKVSGVNIFSNSSQPGRLFKPCGYSWYRDNQLFF